MPTSALGTLSFTNRTRLLSALAIVAAVVFLTAGLLANAASAADLKVMTTGLGAGTVSISSPISSPVGINCGSNCDANFPPLIVTLTAIPGLDSAFDGWDIDQDADPSTVPDCAGLSTTCMISMEVSRSVRPRFRSTTPVVPFVNFTPAGIQKFLNANPMVDTAAEFVGALPPVFRENWILMSRSESLQTGTAEYPRLLLFNGNATSVFTVGIATHSSYPGSHPNAIEYMQWDAGEKNFKFHEIILAPIGQMGTVAARTRQVAVDDIKCSKCHSTQNVRNTSSLPGTNGIPPGTVKVKNKPNWDTYDSWGAMLPFNRDRIYNGSVEATAIRRIFNPWTWRSRPEIRAVIEQLKLQPLNGTPPEDMMWRMRGGANDGQIRFAFDMPAPDVAQRENAPQFDGGTISTNYGFNGLPGTGSSTTVSQEGAFITLQHSPVSNTDEGRGVQLFDLLGGADGQPNAIRIADELVSHRFATGSVPIDVRPIALAVLDRCITNSPGVGITVSGGTPLTIPLGFFQSRNGMTVDQVVTDTLQREKDFPRRKADFQRFNLDNQGDAYVLRDAAGNPVQPQLGLIQQYLASINDPNDVGIGRVREEVFRRSGGNDQSVMGGRYVDREIYPSNSEIIGLARFFLEPLGVSVDKWSLSVRGRSRSYTFADVLGTQLNIITPILRASLGINTTMGNLGYCPAVISLVNSTLGAGQLPDATDVPTFTDIQRIFNKSCIECHGGLGYPPYQNFGTSLDLSEKEAATGGTGDRMSRSYSRASSSAPYIYSRITNPSEACTSTGGGMMPFCGPPLSKTDIETFRRWKDGGTPYTEGDPHIATIDGVNYDFQGAGEYVLLRDEGMELQARHSPVATVGPLGPNPYTGLTSCVSVNTAIALRLGTDRITYQPEFGDGRERRNLQLKINEELAELGFQELILPSGGRITVSGFSGALNFQSQGGTTVTVTPAWWDSQQVWYMNINIRQARGTEGLMGAVAPGNWLPALPDGGFLGPMPKDLQDRYDVLYHEFGAAWRVDKGSTLFDYPPGLSFSDFVDEKWPFGESPGICEPNVLPNGVEPLPAADPIELETAFKICDGIVDKARFANCAQDVSVTGEAGFAEVYRHSEETLRNAEIILEAPVLAFPEDFQTDLSGNVTFAWKDSGGGEQAGARFRLCVWPEDQLFGFNFCDREAIGANNFDAPDLKQGETFFWKVIVEGKNGVFVESETQRFTTK